MYALVNIVKLGRKRKTCPLCKKPDLLLLSNHIRFVHNITGQRRKDLLKVARGRFSSCGVLVTPG